MIYYAAHLVIDSQSLAIIIKNKSVKIVITRMMLQAAAGPVYAENIKQAVLSRAKLEINPKILLKKSWSK